MEKTNGILKTPTRPSAAHYHLKLACVRAVEPNFIPAAESFQIPSDIITLLTFQHRQHIQLVCDFLMISFYDKFASHLILHVKILCDRPH